MQQPSHHVLPLALALAPPPPLLLLQQALKQHQQKALCLVVALELHLVVQAHQPAFKGLRFQV